MYKDDARNHRSYMEGEGMLNKSIICRVGYQKFVFKTVEEAVKFASMAYDAAEDEDKIEITIKYERSEKENASDE